LTERLGYQHVQDFLRDQTGGELAGWLAYLRVDDEVKSQQTTIAILKAFSRGQAQQPAKPAVDPEPVIDTTDPEFAKHFKGFNFEKPKPKRRQQNAEFIS
jgi:hypothetical protein